mgnify:CR=1 FL=1
MVYCMCYIQVIKSQLELAVSIESEVLQAEANVLYWDSEIKGI